MKISHFILLCAVLTMAACKNDNINPDADKLLHHDGENATGPILDAGAYEMAVSFPASKMSKYTGKNLKEIQVFVGILPKTCIVKVYGAGTGSTPGTLLYEKDITASLQAPPAWNKHLLDAPIPLSGDDLWITVAFTHDQKQQSIGCDSGPGKAGGDWLFQSSDPVWKSYNERTGESVNWNIRGLTD